MRCGRLGSLLAFAPVERFRLLAGEEHLTTFEFNKRTIQHPFCSTCGIQSFATGTHPKSGERFAAVNVRCVDDIDIAALAVKHADGKHF